MKHAMPANIAQGNLLDRTRRVNNFEVTSFHKQNESAHIPKLYDISPNNSSDPFLFPQLENSPRQVMNIMSPRTTIGSPEKNRAFNISQSTSDVVQQISMERSYLQEGSRDERNQMRRDEMR